MSVLDDTLPVRGEKSMKDVRGYLIRGGRVIDPSRNFDRVTDVLIEGNVIRAIGDRVAELVTSRGCKTIDAKGMIVAPGFVDLHVHFREPGTEGETIASGLEAAVAGGFTTVCVMPNTSPAIDNGERVAWQHERALECGLARVRVVGALTAGREGKLCSDIVDMARAGVAALSDDGSGVQDAGVMLNAMKQAADLGIPVSDHAEDSCLAGNWPINSGEISRLYGMTGKVAVAEDAMIARDIEIARATGAHLHVAHLSTARGVELVRRAKHEGLRVTAEATPHHMALSESDLVIRETIYDSDRIERKKSDLDPNRKMNPPLRSEDDRRAIVKGLIDGTIDAIATDHAPHPAPKKAKGIDDAPNGVIGLETAFSAVYDSLRTDDVIWTDISRLIELLSTGPAKVFGFDAGTLRHGAKADVTIIDLNAKWKVSEGIRSASRNSPWLEKTMTTRVVHTFVGGTHVFGPGSGL